MKILIGKLIINNKYLLLCFCLFGSFVNSKSYATATEDVLIGKITIHAKLEEEFGSLFEVVSSNEKVIMGSGFGNSCNTSIKNKGTFNTFVTKEFGPEDTYIKSLPNPFEKSYGTTLHYHRLLGLEAMPVDISDRRAIFDESSHKFVVSLSPVIELPPLGRFITMRDEFALAKIIAGEQRELLSSYSNKKGTLATYVNRQENSYDLIVYSWDEAQEKCRMKLVYSDFPLCYGELNGNLLFGTNLGHVYACDASSGQIKVVAKNTPGVSSQYYCMINCYNSVLLGHYPSGNMYVYNGEELTPAREEAPGVKMYGRELQTMALSGGQIYTGIWPWSEVWTFDIYSKEWNFVKRVIKAPDSNLAIKYRHPYEGWLQGEVANELGQRVTNIVPYKNWLFLSTSSKSGRYYPSTQVSNPDKLKGDTFVTPISSPEQSRSDVLMTPVSSSGDLKTESSEVSFSDTGELKDNHFEGINLSDYGKIDVIHTPRNFSIYLPKTEVPAHAFSYLIYSQKIEIWYNEQLMGTVQHTMKKEDLLEAGILKGQGMFGNFKGKILRANKEIF